MNLKKMNDSTKTWLYRLIIMIGYLSFVIHGNLLHPLMLMTTAALIIAGFAELKYKKNYAVLLLPFASGVLCFVMKQFYWDKFEFTGRVHSLILLAALFTIVSVVKKFGLVKKILILFNGLKLKKRLLVIFVFTELLFILSAGLIVKKGVVLGGDEPHYLAISQSIIKDFDLNVFNQYFREGYKEFIDVKKLPAHGAFGKGYKKMYSIHLPGVSIITAPILFLKLPLPVLYFLIRAFLGLFGALLAVVVYLFSVRLWKNVNFSLFITAAFCLTTPVFFHSIHIFPELQALLLILSALYFLLYPGKKKKFKSLLAGLLLGVTVFWGIKYIIFIYLFSFGFFFYFFVKKKERKRAFLFIVFPILLQLLFFSYLYFAYGNFSPMSVYTGMMSEAQAKDYYSNAAAIPLRNRVETLLNYLFDQRDGLLLYNPFYFFAFPGLFIALRKYKTYLPHLLVSAAGFFYILYHGYSTVRPGYCPQARYLVPVMWLFMLFAVIYYREKLSAKRGRRRQKTGNFIKKIFFLLPLYSIFVVIYQALHPFTLYQPTTHDSLIRPGLMFSQWSNLYINIPGLLPSFIKVEANFKYVPNLFFLALFILLIILALKKKTQATGKLSMVKRGGSDLANTVPGTGSFSEGQSPGLRTGYWLAVPLFTGIFLLFLLFPKVPLYNATLVQKKGEIPYRIYGESKRPGRTSDKVMHIPEKGSGQYTISTVNEAKFFVLEFTNKQAREVKTVVYNFDNPVEEAILPPLQTQRVYIEAPRSKKLRNIFFYRFTLFFTSPEAKPVDINVRIFPVKKPGPLVQAFHHFPYPVFLLNGICF
jgi:hypothetical protein